MDESPDFAEMYQDYFKEEKMEKEYDIQKVDDLHAKFDYYGDKNRMANKIKDKRYDLIDEHQDTEDEMFSTDLDEPAIDNIDVSIYRRYKILIHETKLSQIKIDERFKEMNDLLRKESLGVAPKRFDTSETWEDLKKELIDKKFKNNAYLKELEQHIADMRIKNEVRRMDPLDMVMDHHGNPDELLGANSGFDPYAGNLDKMATDPSIPHELRKVFALPVPELQNLY